MLKKENLVSENMEIKFCQVCAVIVLLSTTYQISAQCPRRNQTKADAVGRPCRKPCPSQAQCKDGKICRCDHECGMSCINMNNLCGLPSVTPNMARVRVYRRHSNGSLVLKPSPPYQYDDMAEYECAPGYRLEGSQNFNLCHGRKSWTRLAVCARSCHRFDQEKVLQNLMICGTNCVTSSDCTEDMSCVCDGYCDIDCGKAPPSTHASIKYDGEGFQRRAYYRCDAGFYPQSGNLTRKCTGGGTWSGRLINCALHPDSFCRADPSQVEKGRTCRKSCENDADCKGALKRCVCDDVCGMSCINPKAPCDDLDTFSNGTIEGEKTYGNTVYYTCNDGFILKGTRTRTCRSDKKWTGTAPTCLEIECVVPSAPSFGSVEPPRYSRVALDETITYSCDRGYRLVGQAKATCQGDRTFTDPPPRCQDTECEALGNLRFGEIIGDERTYNKSIYYRCREGYILHGNEKRTCRSDKKWTGSPPECKPGCTSPPRFGGSFLEETKGAYNVGETVTYSCRFGRTLSGNPEISCQRDGWSTPLFFCRRRQCRAPKVVAHATVTSSAPDKGFYEFGDRAFYECEMGYELSQRQNFVNCDTRGEWQGTYPSCNKATKCVLLVAPLHGSMYQASRSEIGRPGSLVGFECDTGFTLQGESFLRCLDSLEWNHQPPVCQAKGCRIFGPTIPAGIEIVDWHLFEYEIGATLQVRCEDRLQTLNNNPVLTCTPGNRWDPLIYNYKCS
ncbi:protein lev-9-like isoform X2 [Clavelina lepadiformis]|uniref:protein lev-9-like isoform X2 n=1 Tax=Clavelina lepadiformis TaxID=159417 RepID=UPI004042E61B